MLGRFKLLGYLKAGIQCAYKDSMNNTTKEQFKKAYRLARQPDLFLACDTDGVYRFKTDIPLGLIILAIKCLEMRIKCQD